MSTIIMSTHHAWSYGGVLSKNQQTATYVICILKLEHDQTFSIAALLYIGVGVIL